MKPSEFDHYWRVVRRCLTDLLDVEPADAEARCDALRRAVHTQAKRRIPLIYHDEPIYVAWELAEPEASRRFGSADGLLDSMPGEYERIRRGDEGQAAELNNGFGSPATRSESWPDSAVGKQR